MRSRWPCPLVDCGQRCRITSMDSSTDSSTVARDIFLHPVRRCAARMARRVIIPRPEVNVREVRYSPIIMYRQGSFLRMRPLRRDFCHSWEEAVDELVSVGDAECPVYGIRPYPAIREYFIHRQPNGIHVLARLLVAPQKDVTVDPRLWTPMELKTGVMRVRA